MAAFFWLEAEWKPRLLLCVFELLEALCNSMYRVDVLTGIWLTDLERNSCLFAVIKSCFTRCLKQNYHDFSKVAAYNKEETASSMVCDA